MKFGMRKPSIKKSIKARTTGKIKRNVKSTITPIYGKKGMGIVHNPKKAIYDKIYNKSTIGISDIFEKNTNSLNSNPNNQTINNYTNPNNYSFKTVKLLKNIWLTLTIISFLFTFIAIPATLLFLPIFLLSLYCYSFQKHTLNNMKQNK